MHVTYAKQYSGSSERHSKIYAKTAAAVVASPITWVAIFGHQYGLLGLDNNHIKFCILLRDVANM